MMSKKVDDILRYSAVIANSISQIKFAYAIGFYPSRSSIVKIVEAGEGIIATIRER